MDEQNTPNNSQSDMILQNIVSKEDSQPQILNQNIKKINESQGKDPSNEVIYFSINQDSK
jgi:hypothetical protein